MTVEFKSYHNLVQRLKKQCDIYKRLDESGDIGKQPSPKLYSKVPLQTGGAPTKSVPDEAVSEYLRGGIISSFVEYEAFLHGVLYEMVDKINVSDAASLCELRKSTKHKSRNDITDSDADWCKSYISNSLGNPRWCTFKEKFNEIFCRGEVQPAKPASLELLYAMHTHINVVSDKTLSNLVIVLSRLQNCKWATVNQETDK